MDQEAYSFRKEWRAANPSACGHAPPAGSCPRCCRWEMPQLKACWVVWLVTGEKHFPCFDFSNVTVASCNRSLEQGQFLRAADILLHCLAGQHGQRSCGEPTSLWGKNIQQTPSEGFACVCLKQKGPTGDF